MPKVLKPYTIIPSNLYVHRDADRQVKNIVKDMGRPGYVLVSRQMGKTNLLLNAKRELESSKDIFVYVDLSNPFSSAKLCFENIIDTAIETNFAIFENAQKTIVERRQVLKDSPAHKQHTNELRVLLNCIEGKLVIILDEIDALTKTDYSDQIFAQIRSIYFSRVNFEELNRLTYLLSGVIEPTEIIKDPKISPFNIGQKIFLNDFSKEEFLQFLEKAQLSLDKETIERIYFWINGNPRMTWDLCSEVENQLKLIQVNSSIIDKLVSEIYLTTYDKPPIDNIRELIKKDGELRNAVIDIENKDLKNITDKVKSKLYLAGIINYEESSIQIKNNVIQQCLNIEWLKSLELEEKGLFELALGLIDKGNFSEAILNFNIFLQKNDYEDSQKNLSFFNMAYASIQLGNFDDALRYSEQIDFDKEEESKFYYRSKIQKGLIYYYKKNIEISLNYFKEVIDSGKKDENYLRALLNYVSISLNNDVELQRDNAIKIFNDIINEVDIDKKKLKESFISYLKTVAYFNLANIHKHDKRLDSAKENLLLALKFSTDKTKPIIYLNLLIVDESINQKKEYLNHLSELIINGKVQPTDTDFEKPLDFTYDQFIDVIVSSYSVDKEGSFNKLKSKFDLLGEKSYPNHLYDFALYAMNNRNHETGLKLLNDIYSNREEYNYNLDKKTIYKTVKLLAYFNDYKSNLTLPKEYLQLFENERLEKIDSLDFEIFANTIFQLTQKQNFQEGFKYAKLINSLVNDVGQELLVNYLVIYHLELNLYLYTKNPKVIDKAKEIVLFASKEEFKHQQSNLLGDTGLEIIKQNAANIINPKTKQTTPLAIEKAYGRNEKVKVRYKDGTVIEVKFKNVEMDIKNGKCFILTH